MDFRNTTYKRGIRNNNPGNIIINNTPWEGLVPLSQNTDGKFQQFKTLEHGLRALMTNARTYILKYGANTIEKLMSKWAPPHENDTKKYSNFIATQLNISPTQTLTKTDLTQKFFITIAKAIAQMECAPDHVLIPQSSYEKAHSMMSPLKDFINEKKKE